GPWVAGLIAGAIFAPNVWWEMRFHWPTLEFMRNARHEKMVALEPMRYLLGQTLSLGPGAAPVWIAGLVAALVRREWRLIAVLYIVTLAILLASGSARVEYVTLPCVALFAAG